MILNQLDHVEVEALPKNLPDELVADATKLAELHDKITVADLTIPEGVTVLTDLEHPIATVVETRAQMADEAAEEEAAEGEGVEGEEGEGAEPTAEAESTEEE
jgi:large subunit ribosomal protein L25